MQPVVFPETGELLICDFPGDYRGQHPSNMVTSLRYP